MKSERKTNYVYVTHRKNHFSTNSGLPISNGTGNHQESNDTEHSTWLSFGYFEFIIVQRLACLYIQRIRNRTHLGAPN